MPYPTPLSVLTPRTRMQNTELSPSRSGISRSAIAIIIAVAVIVIDQIIKIWVKTSFYEGEDMQIFSWFHLRFIQNNGMAFGMEFGSKLFLTLFRVFFVGLLIYYMCKIIRRPQIKYGYIVCLALVIAGAAGNIIDCLFYGEIFNNPMPPQVAQVVPWGDGYATFLHGRVVDMFYFPLLSFDWPQWMPWVGGRHFTFFDPVFNFADAAISVGMACILLFYYKTLSRSLESKEEAAESNRK